MKTEDFIAKVLKKTEEGSDENNQKGADAIFTCKPEIKNGVIENYGDVWVILNTSQEELEDFFREGLEFVGGVQEEFPLRSDPKPMMCLRIKSASTLLISEAGKNSDYLLSKIISKERERVKEIKE